MAWLPIRLRAEGTRPTVQRSPARTPGHVDPEQTCAPMARQRSAMRAPRRQHVLPLNIPSGWVAQVPRRAGQGTWALAAELVSGEIGRPLRLPVSLLVFAEPSEESCAPSLTLILTPDPGQRRPERPRPPARCRHLRRAGAYGRGRSDVAHVGVDVNVTNVHCNRRKMNTPTWYRLARWRIDDAHALLSP